MVMDLITNGWPRGMPWRWHVEEREGQRNIGCSSLIDQACTGSNNRAALHCDRLCCGLWQLITLTFRSVQSALLCLCPCQRLGPATLTLTLTSGRHARRQQAERAGNQTAGKEALAELQEREQHLQADLDSKAAEAQRLVGDQEAHAGGEVKELVSLTDRLAKQ